MTPECSNSSSWLTTGKAELGWRLRTVTDVDPPNCSMQIIAEEDVEAGHLEVAGHLLLMTMTASTLLAKPTYGRLLLCLVGSC